MTNDVRQPLKVGHLEIASLFPAPPATIEGMEPNPEKSFEMLVEAVDQYRAKTLPDGRMKITILVPQRFVLLWLVKLNQLRGTPAEMRELEDANET
jgi:hypothetical protein